MARRRATGEGSVYYDRWIELSYRTIGLPANATVLLAKHRTEQRRAQLTLTPHW